MTKQVVKEALVWCDENTIARMQGAIEALDTLIDPTEWIEKLEKRKSEPKKYPVDSHSHFIAVGKNLAIQAIITELKEMT